MPLNVRRFCTSVVLTLTALGAAAVAQTIPQNQPTAVQTPAQTTPIKAAPTSAEIMRDRISKAKAFIAVRNYNAAIYELENIRRESSDPSVLAVTTVLLMNSYLEQGDYKRAQDFLNETFNQQKANRQGAAEIYNAVAGQVVKGARTKVDRYRALGLSVSDRNLPLEAVNDVENMRNTLELVITQAKENGKDANKAPVAMALLEEATNSRSALARDDYDAKRWKDEVADSREQLANSRSVITNAVDGSIVSGSVPVQTVAMNNPAGSATQNPPAPEAKLPEPQPANTVAGRTLPANNPAPNTATETTAKPSDTAVARNDKPAEPAGTVTEQVKPDPEPVKREEPKTIVVQNTPRTVPEPVKQTAAAAVEAPKMTGPLEVGSLVAYATKQASPVYPAAARSMRASGIVKVEVTVDENGEVAEVQNATGPTLLQTAARDAVRKWRFKPFVRDGQPVKATGFVSFNFTL